MEQANIVVEDHLWELGAGSQFGIRVSKAEDVKAGLALANRVQDVGEEGYAVDLPPIRGLAEISAMPLTDAISYLSDTVPYIESLTQITLDCVNRMEFIPDGWDREDYATFILCTRTWDEQNDSLVQMMNRKLRVSKRKEICPFLSLMKQLLLTIGKLPNHTGRIWCGTKGDRSSVYRQGNVVTWWGIRSFTVTLRPLLSSAFLGKSGPRTIFTLECTRGKRIERPNQETEVLLPPGVLVRVHDVLNAGDGLRVVEVEEISPVESLIDFPRVAYEFGSAEYFLRELDDAAKEANTDGFIEVLTRIPSDLEAYLYENAFATFTDLCHGRHLRDNVVGNLLKLIVAVMTGNLDNGSLQAKSCSVVSTLLRAGGSRSVISKQNVIASTVRAIHHHLDRVDVVTSGCFLLQHLLYNDRNRIKAAKQFAIGTVISAMRHHPDEADVQDSACRTLCLLSINRDNQISIAAKDGIKIVRLAMENHQDHIQLLQRGCLFMARLSVNSQITTIGGEEIKTITVTMERHVESPEIQENGCLAIARMSQQGSNQAFTRELNCISLVLMLMNTYPENKLIQQNAVMALVNMSYDEENQRIIVEKNGLDTVLTAMEAHTEMTGLQENGCRFLATLSKNINNKRSIEEKGCVKAVTGALARHIDHGGIQVNGCLALAQLEAREQETRAVLIAFKEHPDHVTLQECALKALVRMSSQVANRKTIIRDCGIHLIVSSMERFVDNPSIQQHGCNLLAKLSGEAEGRMVVSQLGGIRAMLIAMEQRPFHSGTQTNGCSALVKLSQTDDNHEAMRKLGCVEVVQEAMRNHPYKDALQLDGKAVLKRLGPGVVMLHSKNC